MDGSKCEVAVIGAGISGIAFARFYLDVHPESEIVLIEKDSCIGGVWSQARNFDDFWAQSPLRMTALADQPMQLPTNAPHPYDTFEAKYVTKYLENYVDSHVYKGISMRDRIWLNHEVVRVEKTTQGHWRLQLKGAAHRTLECSKLAVASGLTSQPSMPRVEINAGKKRPHLHHRDFGRQSRAILANDSPYSSITVLGGGKSAADMVYAAVKAGKDVSWIVRGSGEGPGIFINPASTGRYRSAAEKAATQNATALNPSSFRPLDAWARELHHSAQSRGLLESRLFAADEHFKKSVNYRHRENSLECFRELEPTATFFWNNGPVGLIQHDDFWDFVSQKVKVYRSDPVGSTESSIVLENGSHVATDILLCGTGWSTMYHFFTPLQIYELGLPHSNEDTPRDSHVWQAFDNAADEQILKDFPILAAPPAISRSIKDERLTPARLYRGIASIYDRSIVFLGRERISNNFRAADAQAVWATAYWDGFIELPGLEAMQRDISYMNMFSRRRYPSHGLDGLNFHGDLIWYTDTLLVDAGLYSHRKGWWEDRDEPCFASDLQDCKEEYLAKYGTP